MRTTDIARERLSENYQLSLIVLVAVIVVVFVTPFAVFRFVQGNYPVAIADFAMVAVALLSAIRAWKTGKTRTPGMLIAVLLSVGAVVVTIILGLEGALWIYPLIMFMFYLSPPLPALLLTFGAISMIVAQELFNPGATFLSTYQMISYVVTTVTAAIFSFFFARRTNTQYAQLERWATKDPLTGLYNRRNLDDELSIALASRDRHHLDYGMIILDLDNFKALNDKLGHAAGDQILKDLAELIRSSTRVDDRAFRYGGDEFVILLPNTDRDGLTTIAHNLVHSIAENLRCEDTSVTASLGAALLTANDDRESWNKRADRCLYRAKEEGRNTAVLDIDDDTILTHNTR